MPAEADLITQCADLIRARHESLGVALPTTAMILGSGLGQFGDVMAVDAALDYGDLPGFARSTVEGHAGRLLVGSASGHRLMCMQGRMHLYEGYAPAQIAHPIRVFRTLGVQRLIVTNAAGSLRPEMTPGALMRITDHINFSGQNPLTGPNDARIGPRFPDMSQAYCPQLANRLDSAAAHMGVPLHTGVYLQVSGPNFETPAEIRMFARMGADAVGMSTVPEVLVARHAGLQVLGLSLITNLAAGLSDVALTHDETMREASAAVDGLNRLFLRFFEGL